MKLSTRFFLILLAFSMIPLMISGVWFLRSSRASQENARQFHLQMVRLAEDIVESYAADLNRALGFVTELERIFDTTLVNEQKILQQASARNANFALLAIVAPSGKEVVRMSDPEYFKARGYEDRANDPLFIESQKTGRVQIGQAIASEAGPWLPVVHPLLNGYHLYVGYALKPLWRRINSKSVGKSGRLLLLDSKGVPLPGIAEGFPAPRWADESKVVGVDDAWIDRVHTNEGIMVGALSQAPAFGWKILTMQPRTEAYAVSDKFVLQVVTFIVIVALFTAAGAYWMTGRITFPLNALIRGAQRAARQELDIAVPEVGWGELNILAKTFNEMMRTLWVYQEMQVERSLDEKARVEALVHTIPDGIMLASFDGTIVYMNGSARALMGMDGSTGTLKGKMVGNVIRDPTLRQMAVALMARRKVLDHAEIELKNNDGERLGVYSCRGVTVMQDKREVGILILLRDVTAEKELDKMKDDFFHSIVHDLRNPLATIDGFIQLMQERSVSGAQVATYLRYVQESSEALKRLVTNILDAAKLESGTLNLNVEPFDVDAFIEHMKAIYILQAETHGVMVFFDIGSRLNVPFACDKELIERVVINLMGNALKFTPKGGTIRLRVDAIDQTDYEFSVKDTGPGIPVDKLDFVFEKFKQLEGKKKAQGYGLGLSICKKVVELHGGRIWAESKPGDGSRFVFRLPAAKQPAKA